MQAVYGLPTGAARAAPGSGFELNTDGGQGVIKPHGSAGAAVTITPVDGNVHSLTLDANCTLTLAAPVGTGDCTLGFWVSEDGTGGWTLGFAGSVTELGAHDTTLSTTQLAVATSINGGTTWVWAWVGASVTSVGLTMPTGFTVTGSPVTGSGVLAVAADAESANLVWAGPASGSAAAPAFRALVAADIPAGVGAAWRPVMVADLDGTHWNVLVDGGGNAISTY